MQVKNNSAIQETLNLRFFFIKLLLAKVADFHATHCEKRSRVKV